MLRVHGVGADIEKEYEDAVMERIAQLSEGGDAWIDVVREFNSNISAPSAARCGTKRALLALLHTLAEAMRANHTSSKISGGVPLSRDLARWATAEDHRMHRTFHANERRGASPARLAHSDNPTATPVRAIPQHVTTSMRHAVASTSAPALPSGDTTHQEHISSSRYRTNSHDHGLEAGQEPPLSTSCGSGCTLAPNIHVNDTSSPTGGAFSRHNTAEGCEDTECRGHLSADDTCNASIIAVISLLAALQRILLSKACFDEVTVARREPGWQALVSLLTTNSDERLVHGAVSCIRASIRYGTAYNPPLSRNLTAPTNAGAGGKDQQQAAHRGGRDMPSAVSRCETINRAMVLDETTCMHLVELIETGANCVSPGGAWVMQEEVNDAHAQHPRQNQHQHRHGGGILPALAALDILECVLHSNATATDPEVQNRLIVCIRTSARALMQLCRSNSCAMVQRASAVLRALLLSEACADRLALQDEARTSCTLLWHILLALDSEFPAQRTVSCELVELLVDENTQSFELLQRILPPSLMSSLYVKWQQPAQAELRQRHGPERERKTVHNWPLLFERIRGDAEGWELIWNETCRDELRSALLSEIEAYEEAQYRYRGDFVTWNAHEFNVTYESLSKQIKVGRYYISFILHDTFDVNAFSGANKFLGQLYHTFLTEDSPHVRQTCLRVMSKLYTHSHAVPFDTHTLHCLVEALDPPTCDAGVRAALLTMLETSVSNVANGRNLVLSTNCLRVLARLCARAHRKPLVQKPDKSWPRECVNSTVVSQNPDHKSGNGAQRAPDRLHQEHAQEELIYKNRDAQTSAGGGAETRASDDRINSRGEEMGTGDAVREKNESKDNEREATALKSLHLLRILVGLQPSVSPSGALIRPVPLAKRALLAPGNIPHILQLLLLGNKDINAAVVQLLEVLFQHNEHAALVQILHTGIVGLLLLLLRAELVLSDENSREVSPGPTLRAVAVGRLLGALLKAEVAVQKQSQSDRHVRHSRSLLLIQGARVTLPESHGDGHPYNARAADGTVHARDHVNEGGQAHRKCKQDATNSGVMSAREQMLRMLPVALILQVSWPF